MLSSTASSCTLIDTTLPLTIKLPSIVTLPSTDTLLSTIISTKWPADQV